MLEKTRERECARCYCNVPPNILHRLAGQDTLRHPHCSRLGFKLGIAGCNFIILHHTSVLYCFVGNTWNRSRILAQYCAIPTKGPIHMLVCLPLPPTPIALPCPAVIAWWHARSIPSRLDIAGIAKSNFWCLDPPLPCAFCVRRSGEIWTAAPILSVGPVMHCRKLQADTVKACGWYPGAASSRPVPLDWQNSVCESMIRYMSFLQNRWDVKVGEGWYHVDDYHVVPCQLVPTNPTNPPGLLGLCLSQLAPMAASPWFTAAWSGKAARFDQSASRSHQCVTIVTDPTESKLPWRPFIKSWALVFIQGSKTLWYWIAPMTVLETVLTRATLPIPGRQRGKQQNMKPRNTASWLQYRNNVDISMQVHTWVIMSSG